MIPKKAEIIAPVFYFLLLIACGVQLLFVYRPLSAGNSAPSVCQFYLCDEEALAKQAFDLELEKPSTDSLKRAIRVLEAVLTRDSAAPRRWVDLGQAYEQARFLPRARLCFSRALSLGSNSTDILIATGDFFLKHNEQKKGISCLNQALDLASDQDQSIFSYFSARQVSVSQILESQPALSQRAAQSFLHYLISEAAIRDAAQVWRWSEVHHLLDQRTTSEYANFLLQQHRPEEAFQAFASQLGFRTNGYGKTEFIFNGDFEQDPNSAAFDWRIKSTDHVEAALDWTAFSGKRSLKLSFDGMENTDYGQTVQESVLPPGEYQLEAFVRSQDVTTDQGVRLQIRDLKSPKELTAETENITGSCSWRKVETSFSVLGGSRPVEISIRRNPSLRLDNKISGTIWVDQVSIRPIS